MSLGRILREPLLHFLLIGLGLFLLYGQVAPGDADSRRIVVSQAQVDDMVRQYEAVWGAPPKPADLRAIVEAHVRDEILYRAGMDEGLGRDDPVIERRIRQKLEVMAEEENDRATPSDAELSVYRKAHPARFQRPAQVSFEQFYFDPAAPDSAARIAAAKAELARGETVSSGVSTMLPRRIEHEDVDLVARDFGADFAAALAKLPVGRWVGPVPSGVGVHLVRVIDWTAPAAPPLASVREDVRREWENDRRKRALEANYRKLAAHYHVVVEAKLPAGPPG